MIEADRLLVLPFVVDIEQDMLLLDYGQIREIDAGEGVVAFGALLFPRVPAITFPSKTMLTP